jgi:DNA (cytosine-5)-methyltransferase 1
MTREIAVPTFYEFFAGGGMARAGLGDFWRCLFANDFDQKKVDCYRENWGDKEVVCEDIKKLNCSNLPHHADLIWASFPCQDLSLAGGGAGLRGNRSGTFWPFWSLVKNLIAEGRAPETIVLENVCGTLTSHGGKDFTAICGALAGQNYSFGALIIDAAVFLPQSRPRLFIVATRSSASLQAFSKDGPSKVWHSRSLVTAQKRLPKNISKNWVWIDLPTPPQRRLSLEDIIEDGSNELVWHEPSETEKLLAMMSPLNRRKIEIARDIGLRRIGTIYRRTRPDGEGGRIQRAEVRFDDVAGCLRTPAGGSSRQIIVVVEGGKVRSRLISARETARLMGLPDSYKLPQKYNEAYHLTGDGVAVPAVKYLNDNLLLKLLASHPEELAV